MRNKNARIIIPFVAAVWLVSAIYGREAPFWFQLTFFVGVGVAIVAIVLYLMTDTGWRRLGRAFPLSVPFTGQWQVCNAGNMSRVSVRDPDFRQHRTRFAGVLRVGSSPDSLYLKTVFTAVPLLRRFFPAVQVPWSAFRSARTYTANGWVTPSMRSPAVLRATYDPHYTGAFVELVVGEPPVFMQLPLSLLGDGIDRLGLAAPATSTSVGGGDQLAQPG